MAAAGAPGGLAIDAVLRAQDSAPVLPASTAPLHLTASDAVFVAGQVYLLTRESIPASLNLMLWLTPAVFLFAAIPLAWVLAHGIEMQWQTLARPPVRLDSLLRFARIVAPAVGLVAIVGLLTAGAYFQLRLATSNDMAGHATYFNVFLTSGVESLAMSAAVIAWLDAAFEWNQALRSLSYAFWSMALGSVILLWIEPLAMQRLLHSDGGLPALREQNRFLFAVPLLFAAAGFLGLVLGGRRRRPSRLSKWAGEFRGTYRDTYEDFVKPQPDARGLFGYLLRVFSFHVAWAVFPLVIFLWRCLASRRVAAGIITLRDAFAIFRRNGSAEAAGEGILLRLWLLMAGLPIPLLWLACHRIAPLASLGKEAVPSFVVLWAAWELGRISFFVQTREAAGSAQNGSKASSLWPEAAMVSSAIAFMLAIFLLPSFFTWIYEPWIIAALILALIATCIVFSAVGHWKSPAVLLFHALPFFAVLFMCSIVFNDYGALLVWAWALSWICAWALMLNALLTDPQQGWFSALGTLPCSLLLLCVPLMALGGFDSLRQTGILGEIHNLSRPIGRFRLVAAPFYYGTGEWLAKVHLMAAGQDVGWIPNLNSDVALNGQLALLPSQHHLFIGLFLALLCLLIFGFGENFRYAAGSRDPQSRTQHLQAALMTGAVLFALGMLLFVHLGASVFDVLPLTGVPCPWLSHAPVCHIVMTPLVLAALAGSSASALRYRKDPR
jgi:hypothetical protein